MAPTQPEGPPPPPPDGSRPPPRPAPPPPRGPRPDAPRPRPPPPFQEPALPPPSRRPDRPLDGGPVPLLHLPRLELLRQPAGGLGVAREQHHPGHRPVQPVR